MIRSFAELRRQLDTLIDGIVGALWGLVGVGFVIGGVAVANTLTMSVLEQTRELGLLRVIGMTRSQVRKIDPLRVRSARRHGSLVGHHCRYHHGLDYPPM